MQAPPTFCLSSPAWLWTRWLAGGCLVLLAGCVTQPMVPTQGETPTLPASYRNDRDSSPEAVPLADKWWQALGNPDLDRLVEQALLGNPDLKIAELQLKQATARAVQVRSGGLPTINLPVLGSVQAPGGTVGSVPVGSSATRSRQTSYQGSLQASYRLDLWGEQSAKDESAEQLVMRAGFERDNTRRNLASGTVTLFVNWLSINDSIRLAQDAMRALEQILKQTEERFSMGDATVSELEQQRAALAVQRSNLPYLLQQQEDTRSQIGMMLGVRTDEVLLPDAGLGVLNIPALSVGLPSSLLLRRPDVRAVEARMQAARADVAAARARMLPTVDLVAQGGFSALGLVQLLRPESLFWNGIASVTAAVFDGGRREGERVQAQAYYEEMVVTYGKVVYQALREVENGLFLVKASADRYDAQTQAATAAQHLLDAAHLAYQAGAIDFGSVLDARRNHQRQTDEWLRSKAEALRAYVALAKALD